VGANIVAKVELDSDHRQRHLPHVFYGLTEEGREDLEAIGVLEAERILQETTVRTDIPVDVHEYMTAPRPDWGPANAYD